MRRALAGRRRLAAASVLAAAIVAVVAVSAGALPGDGTRPSRAATISTAVTEIRRQDLVEVESEDGKLGHGDSRAVVNRLSGTVTWLPEKGAVVKPDQRLYEVDGSPVILLDGSLPSYRALSASVSDGRDVAELESNLRTLGYDPGGAMTVDGGWDAGTTAAVIRWQEAHDLEQTGTIELGRVIFQPGRRRIESIAVTLGGDTGGGGGGGGDTGSGSGSDSSSSGASAESSGAQTRLASYSPASSGPTTAQTTTPEENAERERSERELARKERELKRREAALRKREQQVKRSEQQQQRQSQEQQAQQQQQQQQQQQSQPQGGGASDGGASSAATADSGDAASGAGVATQLMTTTSTQPVVTVDLDTSKEALARVGAAVSVDLPSGGRAGGRIASVGKVATAASSDSGSDQAATSQDATVEVTIRLARRVAALDEAPATVNFERSRRRDVLAIPVTALLARSGGTFAVEVRDGGARRIVPVTPGLYTSGYVEIEGKGLEAGMKVTDARV